MFDISILRVSVWLFEHHTNQFKSRFLFFLVKYQYVRQAFAALNLFFIVRFTFGELYSKNIKIKWEEIQAQVYASIKTIKTIDQSFMTNLKIYLQQSHIDFKISPTKIYVHTEQARLINALCHQYEGTRPNSHVIHTIQAIKFFEDFSIFMGF